MIYLAMSNLKLNVYMNVPTVLNIATIFDQLSNRKGEHTTIESIDHSEQGRSRVEGEGRSRERGRRSREWAASESF